MNSSVAALDASIDDLLRLHDELGVLSITVGVEQEARRQPHPWEIQLDNDLRALRTQLRADDDRARRMAVEERLDALAPALADLVDAAEEGRGRALYAGVASGEVRTFRLQVALPTEVVLGEIAHVVPLLRVDDGRVRVIVLVGYDAIRVIEVGSAAPTSSGPSTSSRSYTATATVADRPRRIRFAGSRASRTANAGIGTSRRSTTGV